MKGKGISGFGFIIYFTVHILNKLVYRLPDNVYDGLMLLAAVVVAFGVVKSRNEKKELMESAKAD